ncbi:MAG: DEAD/DEAH box helicase family protein [Candidatus Yonathbacteria bacterium]|nr:DEAD/DEAH box helicase family protein [Candidatus Yonathbacteria bacterium]
MELKKYQKNTLETLEQFLKELRKAGLKYAFMGITEKPYHAEAFGEVPFVCIKIPTGGGKTLVGCHAIEKIMTGALHHKLDRGIVLWFTPSEAIKTQTLKKFKDRKDWHRRVLDEAFDNSVKVFSNEEALSIRKEDVNDNLCIVISSLEAFRKEKSLQNKYKVYQENGTLLTHFENIDEPDYLERDSEGSVINSLANVVRLSNPLIVIDEGHKTTTKLSIDFLKDLNPSFIVEYTATPRSESNILVEIHASELKDEQMVKIPIVLESSAQWQNSVTRGIEKRIELEKDAKKIKGEYIRPIALLQAQPKSKDGHTVTVEHIKDFLLERKISADEIAIKTSEKNELEGVDLFSKSCKIRYIITVNALAEGWDCSFAYILVSVANLGSKIAVEQIIGRIIRLPYAKRKANEDFNRSYVFASARDFNEAAGQIISGLESNGYSKSDLISADKKDATYELEAKKAVSDVLKVPMMALEGDQLSFEDLIGNDFELANQDHKFEFQIHYDNDGRAIIDIQKDNEWMRGAQMYLKLRYSDKNYTKSELVQWLDKKLRFPLLEKSDKVSFLDKAIEYQLKTRTLSELSVNRYVLADRMSEFINGVLEKYAKEKFDTLLQKKKISTKPFEAFPNTISLKQAVPQEFNRNYYEKIDKLNGEELSFVQRLDLDTLPNIKYWVRSREKVDPFYIQGWKRGKFYPDFIAVTKKGQIIALEWKGADRISNEDTAYKIEIGEVWSKLGGGKLHFFLVHTGNVEETLRAVKEL